MIYGSAVNNSGQTVTLELDIYEPTGDTVTERPAIVWVHGGSFCCGDKNSPELVDEATVFAKKGYFNVSINYRLEPGGCSAGGADRHLHHRDPGSPRGRADRGAVPADERGDLRDRRDAHRDRRLVGGRDHGAERRLQLAPRTRRPRWARAVSLSGANLLGAIDSTDAPSLLFHGTADNVVPYQWAVNTWNQANAVGLDSFLTSWPGAGHVPYVQHRTEILDQTTNFLWWEMDLANAAQ